jgi:hypothetical protein
VYWDENGTPVYKWGGEKLTWSDTYTLRQVYIQFQGGKTFNNYTIYPMIEIGTVPTEYEPYIEPMEYSVNAEGTVKGVTSLYPSMSLLTDTSGVMIDAEYNKDTNKVIQNLVNAIIALGGNV